LDTVGLDHYVGLLGVRHICEVEVFSWRVL
jgi:hypothetical protein